ncbi:hypothetical protein H0H81_006242 [Sphagnurus paluster]|uniref:RING-type E3 ubiquitin transferase n=1 Tax=Sphagnurus paluster TaxID=117069 RepID=A0A9P7KLH6_9AGAR|nr:hypothetical protein H0H81_006242 [Sphagnurus paluster]
MQEADEQVYASDMPSTLPLVLLTRRLIQQTLYAIIFGIRGIVVATIWLGVLPWATVWTWRMYFSMGESTAWWISGRERPPNNNQESPFYYNIRPNKSVPVPQTFLGRLTSHPLWIALSADIFTGQIIASLIVLTFVAVFLLREWISQNARPGVFEDEEVLADDPPVRVEFPPPARQEGREVNPLDEALARRQIEAMRALDALRARDGVNGHLVGDQRLHGRSPLDLPRKKGKGKQGRKDRIDSDLRAATRRKLYAEHDDENEWDLDEDRLKRNSFSRRVITARMAGARRKAALAAIGGAPPLAAMPPLPVDPKFAFTFKATSSSGSGASTPASATLTSTSSTVFPPVTLLPPTATIPFSFEQIKSTVSPPTLQADVSGGADTEPSSSLNQDQSIRPYLRPSTHPPDPPPISTPDHATTELPSMAIYRAPEELQPEAGPSRLSDIPAVHIEDYVDSDGEQEISMKNYDTFFQKTPFLTVDAVPGAQTDDETDNDEAQDESWRNQYRENIEDTDNDDDEEDEAEAEEEEAAAAEMEDFEFEEWEAVEVEADEIPALLPADGNAGVAVPGEGVVGENPVPVAGAIPAELAEELEANVEDDMEGAMEAIGMRGPIYGVLQNAALMIFVLDTAIGLGIWIPFTVGKSTALLAMNPPRFLQILHLPIRAIRVITDPVVDTVVFFFLELVLPPFKRAVSMGALWLIGNSFGQATVDRIVMRTTKLGSNLANLGDRPLTQIFSWTSSTTPQPQPSAVTTPSLFATFLDRVADLAEPQFALLGMRVRVAWVQLRLAWLRLAIGQTPTDRTFAIILGYVVVGVIVAIYLNLLTVGNARTAGRAVRSAVRQQLLVLKVAAFIFIELVTFPLSCGMVLDLCTVWLFPEANLTSRAAFFLQAPLTATFYHWVAGTMFMYSFAVLLSGCRAVMRSGAMWFIKDPQDQNSHPIRDILDRPILTQLRKICVSGLLYSIVVACVVGSVAGLLLLGSKSVMPFRWKNRSPLSNVPVDLLFLHLVLPYTMHYFRPRRALKEFATVIWKALSKRLRLTSYFFGGRHPAEERSRRWKLFLKHDEPATVVDGTFRRVPATDNLALPRDMRATVAVTEFGVPINEEARQLMAQQDTEMEKAKRNISEDFMIVYIPPGFRYRLICFIALLWVIGAILLGVAVALPVLLGRRFFELFTPLSMHDGYSLIIGFYLLWGFYLIGSAIDRLDKRRQRTASSSGDRAHLPVLIVKRGLVWTAKSAYMALCLGAVIPTLISFVIDLYIILPVRFTIDPSMTPRIRVVDTWALGLLYVKIALHVTRIQPPNRISRGIQHIIANGWTKSDPMQATREVIGPVVGGLLGMIILPGAVFRAVQHFFPQMPVDDKFIFMHVYPGVFMFVGLIRSTIVMYSLLSSWSQSIRDKEFLVEMRLRNHEPEKEKKEKLTVPQDSKTEEVDRNAAEVGKEKENAVALAALNTEEYEP